MAEQKNSADDDVRMLSLDIVGESVEAVEVLRGDFQGLTLS